MAVKTDISENELIRFLSDYDLGEYQGSKPFGRGTVQTTLLLQTTRGKFVLKYYENRTPKSVRFESRLTKYLSDQNFPCPAPLRNRHGQFVGQYNGKPYIFFEYMEGQHVQEPGAEQKRQLIERVAELHILTANYEAEYKQYRCNYSIKLCQQLARNEAERIGTTESRKKLEWLERELQQIRLPESLPKGICHCDFDFSNVLFKDEKFSALLDFDDANYTYQLFDLVALIDSWAWSHEQEFNFEEARTILGEYSQHRSLSRIEKEHLYDVLKLIILIDCVWFFERGNVDDFYERRKIEYLKRLGREQFFGQLFSRHAESNS
jgi:homoserine kinase